MGHPIQRMTDANDAGGAIDTISQSTVFVNSLLVSIDGSFGTSHAPCPLPPIHCSGAWVTANGSANVFIGGIQVNATGDTDTCAHVRVGGSPNVNIG